MSFPTGDSKLEGEIKDVFKPDQELWDNRELQIIDEINKKYKKKNENLENYFNKILIENETKNKFMLPHEKSVEIILYECRIVFINVMNLISSNSYNEAYKYITSSHDNIFSFTLIFITIGFMLLLLSSMLVE